MKILTAYFCSIHDQKCIIVELENNDIFAILKDNIVTFIDKREFEFYKASVVSSYRFYGYVGSFPIAIKGSTDQHYIFITAAIQLGNFHDLNIMKIAEVMIIINCDPQQMIILSEKTTNFPEHRKSAAELGRLMTNGLFYFALNKNNTYFDLSRSFDTTRQLSTGRNFFLWNHGMIIPWYHLNVDHHKWVCPIINGSISIQSLVFPANFYVDEQSPPQTLYSKLTEYHSRNNQNLESKKTTTAVNLKFMVISRLSWVRAGARFLVRGLDDDGFVANFVETEQVVQYGRMLSVFTQIRGSIPLFWSQSGVAMLTHKFDYDRSLCATARAFRKHFERIHKDYGNVIVCNLLANKKEEIILSHNFNSMCKKVDLSFKLEIYNYDFNAHFNINFRNEVWKALPAAKKFVMDSYLYVAVIDNNSHLVVSRQSGVARTNCVDCLDRTNGFQAALALDMVEFQIKSLGVYSFNVLSLSRVQDILKGMWFTNGNCCSQNYAGTAALEKSKTNVSSMLRDTKTNIKRAFVSNFIDCRRNASISKLCSINQPILLFKSSYASITLSCLPNIFKTSSLSPPHLLINLIKRAGEYVEKKHLKFYIGTWNVAGGCERLTDPRLIFNLKIQDWLLDAPNMFPQYINKDYSFTQKTSDSDLIVVGLQEMIDLTASNILMYNQEQLVLWSRSLGQLLSRDEPYVLVSSAQLVGVGLFIFARECHIDHIENVSTNYVKTGLGGTTGNKGAVAISIKLYSSDVCFICSHMAAGNSANSLSQRNQDYQDIYNQLTFDRDRLVSSHDFVFWLGDLNYRLNLTPEEAKFYLHKNKLSSLLLRDQLIIDMSLKKVFNGFKEGPIMFYPTYKYDFNADRYDTSEKSRVPSYTDRILWREYSRPPLKSENSVTQIFYGRTENLASDHRPVCSLFDVEVNTLNPRKLLKVYTELIRDAVYSQVSLQYTISDIGPGDFTLADILNKLANTVPGFVLYRMSRNALTLTYPYIEDLSKVPKVLEFPGLSLSLKIIPCKPLEELEKNVINHIKLLAEAGCSDSQTHKREISDLISFDQFEEDIITAYAAPAESKYLDDLNQCFLETDKNELFGNSDTTESIFYSPDVLPLISTNYHSDLHINKQNEFTQRKSSFYSSISSPISCQSLNTISGSMNDLNLIDHKNDAKGQSIFYNPDSNNKLDKPT